MVYPFIGSEELYEEDYGGMETLTGYCILLHVLNCEVKKRKATECCDDCRYPDWAAVAELQVWLENIAEREAVVRWEVGPGTACIPAWEVRVCRVPATSTQVCSISFTGTS